MGNKVVLELAADATKLAKENQRAKKELESFGDDVEKVAKETADANKENDKYITKIAKVGSGISGLTDAVSNVTDGLGAFNDVMNAGYEQAQKTARANADVMQSQEDYNQALRDSKQAAIDSDQAEVDLQQARLDQKNALDAYNEAVGKFGKNSKEAAQAQIDLKQAGVDVKQANEDSAQALRDANQATIDAKTSQLDLNDAQREAHPTDMTKFIDQVTKFAPLLTGLASITALVTGAQWLWNAAQLASPTTWIVAGIIVLIGIIVLLVKHWDIVKKAGKAAWGWIKDAASDTWNYMKKIPGWLETAFSGIAKALFAPFRAAFNLISSAWNNTIGSLSWTVPGWIPGIGGNTISVPKLPKYHTGGVIPGMPGQEVPIMGLAGETVQPAYRNDHSEPVSITVMLDGDVIMRSVGKAIDRNGGNAQYVLVGHA